MFEISIFAALLRRAQKQGVISVSPGLMHTFINYLMVCFLLTCSDLVIEMTGDACFEAFGSLLHEVLHVKASRKSLMNQAFLIFALQSL